MGGIGRTITVTARYFGVEEGGAEYDPCNVAPFYSGGPLTSNYPLSDDAYSILIYAKALANICNGSIQGINKILQLPFSGRGDCYVTDPGHMTMVSTFHFALNPLEFHTVANPTTLPRPKHEPPT